MKPLFRLQDFTFRDKKVIVRTGFDMPVDGSGKITDDARIKEALPTLNYLLKKGASLIIIFHHHRPDGKVVKKYRVDKIAKRLSQLLKRKVTKVDDTVGKNVSDAVSRLKKGDVLVLENLRFHAEERNNDTKFAKELASYGDYYVNEAFSNCHRQHASMVGIPKYIPGCVGMHVYDEITHLNLHNCKKPIYAIVGGVKLETRVPLLERLAKITKKILIGGAMVFTFYRAMGFSVGKSLVNVAEISVAARLLKKYGKKLVLPSDILVADSLKGNAKTKVVGCGEIDGKWMGVDNGPESIKEYRGLLKDAKTILWNGPIGVFEVEKFSCGTKEIGKCLARSKAKTIIGGGDTSTAMHQYGLTSRMNHVSTAGGASMTLLEGKDLAAINALEKSFIKFKKKL